MSVKQDVVKKCPWCGAERCTASDEYECGTFAGEESTECLHYQLEQAKDKIKELEDALQWIDEVDIMQGKAERVLKKKCPNCGEEKPPTPYHMCTYGWCEGSGDEDNKNRIDRIRRENE
jgi:predicted RNA-binding Zn-ribbon protein involved in translation (DUF1610 family)